MPQREVQEVALLRLPFGLRSEFRAHIKYNIEFYCFWPFNTHLSVTGGGDFLFGFRTEVPETTIAARLSSPP
jgi:hypothetical protein